MKLIKYLLFFFLFYFGVVLLMSLWAFCTETNAYAWWLTIVFSLMSVVLVPVLVVFDLIIFKYFPGDSIYGTRFKQRKSE